MMADIFTIWWKEGMEGSVSLERQRPQGGADLVGADRCLRRLRPVGRS